MKYFKGWINLTHRWKVNFKLIQLTKSFTVIPENVLFYFTLSNCLFISLSLEFLSLSRNQVLAWHDMLCTFEVCKLLHSFLCCVLKSFKIPSSIPAALHYDGKSSCNHFNGSWSQTLKFIPLCLMEVVGMMRTRCIK